MVGPPPPPPKQNQLKEYCGCNGSGICVRAFGLRSLPATSESPTIAMMTTLATSYQEPEVELEVESKTMTAISSTYTNIFW